jgi:hypothetical protein
MNPLEELRAELTKDRLELSTLQEPRFASREERHTRQQEIGAQASRPRKTLKQRT